LWILVVFEFFQKIRLIHPTVENPPHTFDG
jgi:hypothetical protein